MPGRPAIQKSALSILFTCYAGSSCNREVYIKKYCSSVMLGRHAIEKTVLSILFICYAGSSCNREVYINNPVHLFLGRPGIVKSTLTILFTCYAGSSCNSNAIYYRTRGYIQVSQNVGHTLALFATMWRGLSDDLRRVQYNSLRFTPKWRSPLCKLR